MKGLEFLTHITIVMVIVIMTTSTALFIWWISGVTEEGSRMASVILGVAAGAVAAAGYATEVSKPKPIEKEKDGDEDENGEIRDGD